MNIFGLTLLGSVRLFLGGVGWSLKGEGHIDIFWPSGRVRVINFDVFGEGHLKIFVLSFGGGSTLYIFLYSLISYILYIFSYDSLLSKSIRFKRLGTVLLKNNFFCLDPEKFAITVLMYRPCPFPSSLVVEHFSDFLLYNMDFMRQYLDAAESKKSSIPGYGYFNKLVKFEESHCEMGEFYLSFVTHRVKKVMKISVISAQSIQ